MKRDTLEMAVVAVLCILALSVAASTLDSAEGGGGDGGLVGTVAGWLPIPNPTAEERPESAGIREADGDLSDTLGPLQRLFCIPALRDPLLQVAILLAYVAVVGAVVWGGEDLNERMLRAVGTMAVLGTPTVLFLFVFAFTMRGCTANTADISNGELSAGTSGQGGGGDGVVVETLTDPAVLALVVGVFGLVVAAVTLLGTAGDDDAEASEKPRVAEGLEDAGGAGGVSVATVARAAGAAADRIEDDGELDNEVYRAWREMTDGLDVANPRSSTPAEFRAAAVDAGIAPEDVDELTDVFEAVRYGGETPTEARERRAVEALRRIERGYGGVPDEEG